MKIAIIGTGRIGGGLARAWASHGHTIRLGVREPQGSDAGAFAAELGATLHPIGQAAQGADVVTLAMPYSALEAVLEATGNLAGQIVIDCTNAVLPGWSLKYGHTTSAAEELQKRIPEAHVFKSFNAQGAENLANPEYQGVRASNFFCGDDPRGKEILKQLVEEVGFEAVDTGPLQSARLLEPLMLLWITSSQQLGTRDLAFKLLRR